MAVLFHEASKTWHLTNDRVSYIIRVMENGQLENLYYGKKIHDRESFFHFHEEAMRSQMTICVEEPAMLAMHYTRQEFPSYGTGDYRSPMVTVLQENGSRISDFKYVSYRVYQGKEPMLPLPAVYVESPDEAETLEILLKDELTGVTATLIYTIYADYPVIVRSVRFANGGKAPVTLERALSASVEFLDMDYELVQLSGAWSRERYVKTRKLEMGLQGIQSLTGTCSSAEQNPFLALKRPGTGEMSGEVFGFSLVYSGNHLSQVEVSTFKLTRVLMGINPEGFSWKLDEGAVFQTPEVVMVYSDKGLNGMSQVYHRLYRTRLARGVWRDRPRPILLNNWEATYFDFNEEKLLAIARKAKEVGVELFVLDDGWFGARNDDRRGLGDWFVNTDKLPSGISGLSEKIEAMGLKFGLWVELEMVNKDSDLYRAHPDWLVHAPGRYESHARHQHVLDFSRPEVVDAIHDMIAKTLRESKISYIKWDMNRYMSEPWSCGLSADRQGEMMHRYILGVYDLYERLIREFPEILFESCASGGARFDPGMLFFAPQAWCSDDTDGAERQKIQYGTTYVYPLSSIGAHVSAVPNHQLMRVTPLETRANTAMFGTFGYELDLNLLSESEIAKVKQEIEFMKSHRELIQTDGDFYRLDNPFAGNRVGWIVVSSDKTKAVAMYGQRLNHVNGNWLRFKLAGLDPDRLYKVRCDITPSDDVPEFVRMVYGIKDGEHIYEAEAYGDELMNAGIPVDQSWMAMKGGDFTSLLFEIES